jgi:hypothetical protein
MRLLIALLLPALTMIALPGLAMAQGRVTCDVKVKRIADNLRREPMSPDQAERARQALYAAIDQCRPAGSGSAAAAPRRSAERESQPAPDTRLDRQSLRAQQNVLSPSELREGERRIDAIDRKAQTDPGVAREMQRIYEADQSLATINRPIPGAPGTLSQGGPSHVGPSQGGPSVPGPSLVGPGDR